MRTYPKIRGSDDLRGAIAAWLGRRYGLAGNIDPAREILPLNGSREGLFFAALPAVGRKRFADRPLMLLPNPFYQAYLGGHARHRLRTLLPQRYGRDRPLARSRGAGARAGNLATGGGLLPLLPCQSAGRRRRCRLLAQSAWRWRASTISCCFLDECYSEIYAGQEAPTGGLQIGAATPERYKNLIVFNSLSKRSNLPGMRSGFAAGDGDFLETLAEIRNLTAPQMPGIVQHASAAVWSEEQHVTVIRQAYRAKFDICDRAADGPLRLSPPGRRLLPLARHEPSGRRRAGNLNHMETLRCQGYPGRLPGA